MSPRPILEKLEHRRLLSSSPAIAISDVALVEGNAGSRNAMITMSLSAPSKKTVTVNYNTANGTALAGSDYQAVFGTVTFARGQTSKSILVPVLGDSLAEANETFFVNLNGVRNASIADAQGVVTIVDDDSQARISISDAYVSGGYDTTLMTFTVSLAAAFDETVTVNFATQDGSATAGQQDYLATWGTLTFGPGETSKTITVTIIGSYGGSETEYDEYFYLNLSGASANALIIHGQGQGTIGSQWGSPPDGGDPYGTY